MTQAIQANLYSAFLDGFSSRILLCQNHEEAAKAYNLASFSRFQNLHNFEILLMPEMRANYGDDLRSFYSEFMESLALVRQFYQNPNTLLIAPISSLLYPMPSKKYFECTHIKVNTNYELESLKFKLASFGYEIVDMIEMEGEVSFRGDIIDIYPPLSKPYRISFFDTQCENIKEFDIATQLSSKATLDEIVIYPCLFALDSDETQEIMNSIEESDYNVFLKDITSLGFWFLKDKILLPQEYDTIITQSAIKELKEILDFRDRIPSFWQNLDSIESKKSTADSKKLKILPQKSGYEDIDFHFSALNAIILHNPDKQILLLCQSKTLRDSLEIKSQNVKFLECAHFVNIITPESIILSLNPAIQPTKKHRPKIVLDELNVGEYVVHSQYGIGIFKGIAQMSVLGSVRDFIHIAYQGEDKLLLPVENLHLIDRYIAANNAIPMLDKLGKGSFLRLKEKARQKLFEIADSIIKLAAKRNLTQGQIINVNDPELLIFRQGCDFVLTDDQERAIDEIFSDLSSGRVMDRLLSGDVGFGKTEVAMNTIFALYKSGFQCALIVPTTLLCAQHFATLKSRLGGFNLCIEKLDRFTSSKDKARILENLKNGKIDVLIGTHSIFGVEFGNLGLVVIDEEHKFGVKQKEAIKQISQNVHLLSMSATPIPRTLNMALSQIKSMSKLETPPNQRKGSRTFVKQKSTPLLKEVIQRELRRSGQVFYVYNNIATINEIYEYLSEILPNVKIAVLHSQINAKDTEEIMEKFALGEFQILLCTSIVESGIHLPNANTIIIDGADRFGLADLHQLRGRVGRGEKEGFCYFLIDSSKSITQEATKRLLALEKNSYLGSGASIAYYDLEIRGGGNLIGESQSGHIKNIGYSLYLHLLEEAINTLSGKESISENGVELRLSVSAYLSPELIASDRLRLELYRRLALCKEIEEVHLIEEEIYNRFGSLDSMSLAFIRIILIRILATKKRITSILHYGQNIQIQLQDSSKLTLSAPSKDDDDVLDSILAYLRK